MKYQQSSWFIQSSYLIQSVFSYQQNKAHLHPTRAQEMASCGESQEADDQEVRTFVQGMRFLGEVSGSLIKISGLLSKS